MRHSTQQRLRQQVQFLRRQFLQDGDLPFTNVLTEQVITQALTAVTGWLDRVFSPLVTLWVFLGQVLSADHSCRAAVARLIAAYRGGASVAVAAYDGQPRNPVLLAREHWPEVIATATGDQGARTFLRTRPELVTLVECGDTGRPDDIDTPADLARIAAAGTEGG